MTEQPAHIPTVDGPLDPDDDDEQDDEQIEQGVGDE